MGRCPTPRRGDSSPQTPREGPTERRTVPPGDCRWSRTEARAAVGGSPGAAEARMGRCPTPRRGDASPRTPREGPTERRTAPPGDCRCSRTIRPLARFVRSGRFVRWDASAHPRSVPEHGALPQIPRHSHGVFMGGSLLLRSPPVATARAGPLAQLGHCRNALEQRLPGSSPPGSSVLRGRRGS